MAKATPARSKKKTTAKAKPKTASKKTVSAAEAEAGKGMAIVGYLVFFIPLLLGEHRKSEFVRFHTNQGTVLFIVGVGGGIVLSILGALFGALFVSIYSFRLLGFFGVLGAILWPIFSIGLLVLEIIGILNAIKGRMNPVPIFGRFEIVK